MKNSSHTSIDGQGNELVKWQKYDPSFLEDWQKSDLQIIPFLWDIWKI